MSRKTKPERRIQFLEAALGLFVSKGIQRTTTAEIAKKAGAAAGTLFLYFPTKQELINELTLKIGREQAQFIESLLRPSQTVREAFFTIWEGSIRWFLAHNEAYRYVQQVRDSGIVDPQAVRESAKFFQYYYSAIQKGLGEKRIKPYPFELVGAILYQMVTGVANLALAQPGGAKQEEYIREGFEIFWNGIKTEEVK